MLNFNLVSYILLVTVYKCPNTEKYRVNKIHIDPGIFRIQLYTVLRIYPDFATKPHI